MLSQLDIGEILTPESKKVGLFAHLVKVGPAQHVVLVISVKHVFPRVLQLVVSCVGHNIECLHDRVEPSRDAHILLRPSSIGLSFCTSDLSTVLTILGWVELTL